MKDQIRELIGECAGYVSLCWEPKPAGVFDSTLAAAKVDETVEQVLSALTAPVPGQSSGHHVKIVLEQDVVRFNWVCAEPAEAQCHLYCECEESAPQPGDDGKCERCEEPIRQLDYCNLVTWFEEGGTGEEQYSGDTLVLLNAEIEAVWEGDYYTWKAKG